tara:strand:- start:10160 stop:10348 length:189 start_codon:yes stop_codon:yes gene_type:complete
MSHRIPLHIHRPGGKKLKRLLADAMLDNAALKDILENTWQSRMIASGDCPLCSQLGKAIKRV